MGRIVYIILSNFLIRKEQLKLRFTLRIFHAIVTVVVIKAVCCMTEEKMEEIKFAYLCHIDLR